MNITKYKTWIQTFDRTFLIQSFAASGSDELPLTAVHRTATHTVTVHTFQFEHTCTLTIFSVIDQMINTSSPSTLGKNCCSWTTDGHRLGVYKILAIRFTNTTKYLNIDDIQEWRLLQYLRN